MIQRPVYFPKALCVTLYRAVHYVLWYGATAIKTSAAEFIRRITSLLGFITSHPLNRGQEFQSVLEFVRWQFRSRLLSKPVVFEWISGAKFLVKTGEQGLTGNIYTGLAEFTDMGFVLHFLRKDDLFVDVGANAGAYSILAGSVAGARGYAFEPVPGTYARLEENLRLNRLENRICHALLAISDRKGSLKISDSRGCENHILPDGDGQSCVTVESATLDDLLKDQNPSLLKIDVEGYELSVLRGARQTLAKSSLQGVVMELNGQGRKYGFSECEAAALMREHGFTGCAYDPLTRDLVALQDVNTHSRNTIFVKDQDFVRDRIRNAARIPIRGKMV